VVTRGHFAEHAPQQHGDARHLDQAQQRVVRGAGDLRATLGAHAQGLVVAAVKQLGGPDRTAELVEDLDVDVDLGVRLDRSQLGDGNSAVNRSDQAVAGDAVALGGRFEVGGAVVAVEVDQRVAQAEGLGHADQGVVDGLVAVRVVLAHDVAGDTGAFHHGAVGAEALIEHVPQDAAVHRLEAVTNVGQGP